MSLKQIDHNPNEPPRPLRGEAWFVTIVTVVVISTVLYGLRMIFDYSHVLFAAALLALIALMIPIVLRMDAKR